jgi:hypothetical protein
MSPSEKLVLVVGLVIVFFRLYRLVDSWVREAVRRRSKPTRVGW